VITDQEGKQYKNSGDLPGDYFCYDKDVLAPADGIIEAVHTGIADNKIGDVDTVNNWGNTVVIKHEDYLYSKLSHLKEGSIKHVAGDRVKQGDLIGRVGNSGRSPYPHLHFQFQATPYIGSATLYYPFGYYILRDGKGSRLVSFDVPVMNEKVANIQVDDLLKNAFNLIPGKKLVFQYAFRKNKKEQVTWTVKTNVYNRSYVWCEKSRSAAYFHQDGSIFYFTHFEGQRNSLLYYFYLALYKVQLGFYQDLSVEDHFPTDHLVDRRYLFLHDVVAPFITLLKARYLITYSSVDSKISPENIELRSRAETLWRGKPIKKHRFIININQLGICSIEGETKKERFTATCIE
jgi:murein DD-endopeptidase MepM/ murein hydrolase activator NlpD